jgi:hypothetical protein
LVKSFFYPHLWGTDEPEAGLVQQAAGKMMGGVHLADVSARITSHPTAFGATRWMDTVLIDGADALVSDGGHCPWPLSRLAIDYMEVNSAAQG